MSGWDPVALYRAARHAESTMSGYYNDNVRMDTPNGPVLVRIPLPRADQMDLHIWDEADVLRAVCPRVQRAPRLLHVCRTPAFQIHEFITGRQLNDLAPRGTAVPSHVIPAVLGLFDQLATVPLGELPALPPGWPDDGQCAAFARILSDHTQQVFDDNQDQFGDLYRGFGIPDAPLLAVRAAWPAMSPRPFRLVHADVHRQNILLSPSRGPVFLDWELALWGDPLYELAVHIHKMTYLDNELHTLLHDWETRTAPSAAQSWRDDLTVYLRHEQVKSAIVDSVRYTKEILSHHTPPARQQLLLDKLTGKLNTAGTHWDWPTNLNTQDVENIITTWNPARSHPPEQSDP